jgi:hypothetical protein
MGIPDRLILVADFYHREEQKCVRGRAYLAAVVMQVSALEAALQALCTMYSIEVRTTTIYRKKKFRTKRSQALELKLHQLIDIAAELSWFPAKRFTWAGKRADVAGFTHEIRKIRNYVHPAVWVRERGEPLKFTKDIYDVVYEVFDVANSWLIHKIEQNLLKRLAQEDRAKRAASPRREKLVARDDR